MKDYYAIMGVSDKATADEVLAAWRTRSAVLHPDRFDRIKQAMQWQQANAMFAELREAHEILGDPRRRIDYDRQRRTTSATGQQAPQPERTEPGKQRTDRGPEPDPQLFASRFVDAKSLPLDGLRSLTRAKGSDALFRRSDSGFMNAIAVILGLIGCFLTWAAASGEQLDGVATMWTLAGFAGALWLTLFNTLRLWLARATPFGRGIVVTPYYFAEVRWDRSRLTPLITLRDVGATHHYRNGFYEKTTFRTEWISRSLTFDVASKSDADQLSKTLVESANRLRSAFAAGHGEDIVRRFAFAQNVATLPQEDFKSRRIKILERELAAVAAVGAIILLSLRPAPPPARPPALLASPTGSVTAPATPFADIFVAPEVPFPATGRQVNYTKRENVAPLKLDAVGKASNFLIRLRDAETNDLVCDIFVRAGDVVEATVPLGRYKLLIAAGQTWRGDSVLFGEEGAYAQANDLLAFTVEGRRVIGNRIVLQESVGGNLRKTAMRRIQF